ncbi:hypothetical protein [Nostoc sp. CHAB 5715]|uniref:hypothetical protein n=1 Tax=Nostoc sp. CHAB 5715 TaxID=2780400 RepID=UPI001E5BBEFC|nr:hypothetical protein [Nostoc sp. CHAB 5715]MCC5621604.1 hypothetical protein [Nostoc sp. CHAB 5715]
MNTRLFVAPAVMLALAGSAQASLQVFTASPSYPWTPTINTSGGGFAGLDFDPLQASTQTGGATNTSMQQFYESPVTSSMPTELYWRASRTDVKIAVTPVADFAGLIRPGSGPDGITSYSAPTDFSAAASVGSGNTFSNEVLVGWSRGFNDFGVDYATFGMFPWEYILHTLPDTMIIGLELKISGQTHYGWALVNRTGGGSGLEPWWEVECWAYETTPNTAAVISLPPAP